MSDDNYLKSLLQATQPGAPKKELPYIIPPIDTVISLDANTTKTIKTVAIAIAAGIAIGGIAGAAGRIVSARKSK